MMHSRSEYPAYYALTYSFEDCPRCNGSGKHNGGVCPVCHATGLLFQCPMCEGRGAEFGYVGGGINEPCSVCHGEGIMTLEEIKEYERDTLGDTHENNIKEYNRVMNQQMNQHPKEMCDFCGTDCQSDCQHSRPWRGEMGKHGETIG